MIVITGATGHLGRAVIERLLERLPVDRIAASVRDPAGASALAKRGVRVRRGDYDDPASLADAFADAETVFVVSAATTGEAALRQHRNAIQAAKAAGAHRIVYTSQMGSDPASPFPPMPDHAATEAMLGESGLPFVSLRNGFYAASGLMLLGHAMEDGEIVAPEDGPVAWTAHGDLADVAAITLAAPQTLTGITPPLTAAEALRLSDLADIASEISGREVRRVTVSDADYRAGLVAHGAPESVADMLVGLFAASRAGAFSTVNPTLARLTGHPPASMRSVMHSALARPAP
jgi:NAD(P)H dehydrogenase (quinone)